MKYFGHDDLWQIDPNQCGLAVRVASFLRPWW